jgi:hypothetical protein
VPEICGDEKRKVGKTKKSKTALTKPGGCGTLKFQFVENIKKTTEDNNAGVKTRRYNCRG